jgi:hypothetical protein
MTEGASLIEDYDRSTHELHVMTTGDPMQATLTLEIVSGNNVAPTATWRPTGH